MGLIKSADPIDNPDINKPESGVTAAISRLQGSIPKVEGRAPMKDYKPRDYQSENEGKVRCVLFEAALQSPALAGLAFKTIEEFLVLVKQAAEAGVAYTWEKK